MATVTVQVTRPVRDDYISGGIYQDTPGGALECFGQRFFGQRIRRAAIDHRGGRYGKRRHGYNRGDGKALLYTPAPGYSGNDQFSYTVDGNLTANVVLFVAPLAQSDSHTFCPDPNHAPYILSVLQNDHFNKGYAGPGVITEAELLDGDGTVAIQGGTTLLFDPSKAGWYRIRYTVDGKYEATVNISITNHPDADHYVVDQNSVSRGLDVLANDFNAEPYYVSCPPQIILGRGSSRASRNRRTAAT